MRYLEHSVCTLSELENANVLGHLLAHQDIFEMELVDAAPEPSDLRPYREFTRLAHGFKGYITNSALDPTINPYRSSRSPPPTICCRRRGKSPQYRRPAELDQAAREFRALFKRGHARVIQGQPARGGK